MAKVAARKNRRNKSGSALAKLPRAKKRSSALSSAAFVLASHTDDVSRETTIISRFSKLDSEITQVLSSARITRRRIRVTSTSRESIMPAREVEEKFAAIERDMRRALISSSLK